MAGPKILSARTIRVHFFQKSPSVRVLKMGSENQESTVKIWKEALTRFGPKNQVIIDALYSISLFLSPTSYLHDSICIKHIVSPSLLIQ